MLELAKFLLEITMHRAAYQMRFILFCCDDIRLGMAMLMITSQDFTGLKSRRKKVETPVSQDLLH